MAAIQELVKDIARALVDNPDQVEVSEIAGDHGMVVALKVAAADLGRVIGKQGRTARSLRTVLTAAGMKTHRRVSLDIVEER